MIMKHTQSDIEKAESYALGPEKTVCLPGNPEFTYRTVNKSKKNAFLAGAASKTKENDMLWSLLEEAWVYMDALVGSEANTEEWISKLEALKKEFGRK